MFTEYLTPYLRRAGGYVHTPHELSFPPYLADEGQRVNTTANGAVIGYAGTFVTFVTAVMGAPRFRTPMRGAIFAGVLGCLGSEMYSASSELWVQWSQFGPAVVQSTYNTILERKQARVSPPAAMDAVTAHRRLM